MVRRRSGRAACGGAPRRRAARVRRLGRAGLAAASRPHDAAGHLALGVRVVGEVLVAQELGVRPRGRHHVRLALGRHRHLLGRHADARQHERRRRSSSSGSDGRLRAARARTAPRTRRRTRRSRHGVSTAWPAARSRRRSRSAGSTARKRAVGAEQLVHADAGPGRAHGCREQGEPAGQAETERARPSAPLTHPAAPPARARGRCPRAPSATTPRVSSRSPSSSASSACAHAIVSPTPGSL